MLGYGTDQVPLLSVSMTVIQVAAAVSIGIIRSVLAYVFGFRFSANRALHDGYAPMIFAWEAFYMDHVFTRVKAIFHRPIASRPGAHVDVIERYSVDGNRTFHNKSGCVKHCTNLGSYNYLGFADDWMNTCSKEVFDAVDKFGLASTTPSMEFGTTTVHQELERAVAKFVGKPAAIVYNMGYATNSTSIPAMMGKGTLIISDSMNHSSIVNGARASGAVVSVFRHNDAKHLESVLRTKISEGQPRTHRPWKKIMVMVEGIYSMEGEIVDLRAIVDVAKRYKAYTYVDEAHSVGALGKTGRGICEHAGVDPSEIDILMGTFTKSFGGMGGYVAASEEIIGFVRSSSAGANYATSLSPVIAKQVLTALHIIDKTEMGKKKLVALRENSNYFRQKLMDMGLVTLGDFDSPVIPVMLYQPSKLYEFSRQCLSRGLAVVTVGYPATPFLLTRARICISAAHTREDLDDALMKLEEVVDICRIRYNRRSRG